MNPNNKEASGVELPPPVAEQAALVDAAAEAASAGIEQGTATAEPGPASPPATIPLPLPLAAAAQADATAAPAPDPALLTDDDGDLIEKEWVNKAKQIVERTRNDPYKQSEELTVFKADYMKKRYDKTIKVSQ